MTGGAVLRDMRRRVEHYRREAKDPRHPKHVRQGFTARAADISRELALIANPFGGFAPVPPVRAPWFERWGNL